MTQWVYAFGDGKAEGDAGMKNLLGGKGANLAEMSNLGLPVPPGFTITTEVCTYYYDHGQSYPPELKAQVDEALGHVGRLTGRTFGDARKSAAGLRPLRRPRVDAGHDGHRAQSRPQRRDRRGAGQGRGRRALRLRQLPPLHHHVFERGARHRAPSFRGGARRATRTARGYTLDTDLTADDWKALIPRYKAIVEKQLGKPFPQDPQEQLWGAIGAVFGSWMNSRAIKYRELHAIPASWGTAVNVQAMVFGNMGDTSATGVAFTRNPSTGESELYGEFLINAQGEDVVAGIRTPQDITERARIASGSDKPSMERAMPEAYARARAHLRHSREALP